MSGLTGDDVIVVDENDQALGRCNKLEAHRGAGVLHRAFSVVVIDGDQRVLLQQRSHQKHHFRMLWSNSCCSHPRPGESVNDAAQRRLIEELGIDAEVLTVGRVRYRAVDLDTGLVEHEIDHVLVARRASTEISPIADPAEIADWCWLGVDETDAWLARTPAAFTPWFGLVLPIAVRALRRVPLREGAMRQSAMDRFPMCQEMSVAKWRR